MKKVMTLFLAIILSVSFCSCKSETSTEKSTEATPAADGVVETSKARIEIKDYTLNSVKNQANQTLKAITIYCEFKNLATYENSMFMSGQLKAFQNGFELSSPTGNTTTALLSDDVKRSNTNVQPGYSYMTYYNFILEDETSPVTVKVTSGGKSSEVTYNLTGETNPNQSDEPGVVELENAHVKITDCKYRYYGLDNMYKQYPCAMIGCEYTNKSDKEQCLDEVLTMRAYQNGREIEPTALYTSLNQIDKFRHEKISPNETCTTGFFFDSGSDGAITVKVFNHHGTQLTEIEIPIG